MPDTFKKGDAVKVQLSAKHTLDGELLAHAATFVRYHPDQQWADVDLERHHSIDESQGDRRKIHRLSVPVSQLVAALLLLFLLAFPAKAQEPGQVSLQTVYSNFGSSLSCTGSPQFYFPQNLGQVAHQANVSSNNATSMAVEIDGSDGITQYRMSNPAVSFASGLNTAYVAIGSGTYARIIIVVTCNAGAGYSLTYAGGQTGFQSVNVGPTGGSTTSITGGVGTQVQGVVAQQQTAGLVDPIIEGALQLPINTSFLTSGLDNFNFSSVSVTAGTSGTITVGTAPFPSKSGELAIAFDGNQSDSGSTAVVAPWVTNANGSTVTQFTLATLANIGSGQVFQRSYTNSTPGGSELLAIVEMNAGSSVRQTNSNSSATIAFSSNTLANSTILIGVECTANTTPCTVSGVTDTQGNTYKLVTSVTTPGSSNIPGIYVFATTTPTTAAADTLTPAFSVGTGRANSIVEIAGVQTVGLTQPAISVQGDPTGAQVLRLDAQSPNQFVCNVTLSTLTTTQCQAAATTINGVAVRAYVTDFQINTTTAGTATTVQIKTGTAANCGTGTANLSAIAYPNVATGITSVLGMRTPLIAPLQSAVCATQAGTTAGTSVVEIHGFFAP
jgi:hypothetical protein